MSKEAPLLTIASATFEDFDGTYFTFQNAKFQIPEGYRSGGVEFLLLDNSPDTEHGKLCRDLIANMQADGTPVKYATLGDKIGTSPSRDALFKHATGKFVLVTDCHVILRPEVLPKILEFLRRIDGDPEMEDNIYSGPIEMDTMIGFATHYADLWRDQMWGIWATGWRCGCGMEDATNFQLMERDGRAAVESLSMDPVPLKECYGCGRHFPISKWAGHEQAFRKAGYIPLQETMDPVEIPGMGLGQFLVKRESWLGFHEHARGFGGEELYIHEKYRQAGRKAILLPWMWWLHRFGRVGGVKYPLTLYNKVRNYVLEFQELGRSVDVLHEHFVKEQGFDPDQWEWILKNPIEHAEPEQKCTPCEEKAKKREKELKFDSLDVPFEKAVLAKRDLNEHLHTLREFAEKCDHVTEFSNRKESTIAFMAAKPKTLISFNMEAGPGTARAKQLLEDEGCSFVHHRAGSKGRTEIERTDLLFLDLDHTYNEVYRELVTFGPYVSRFIILHDTQLFGFRGSDNGPGLFLAIRDFFKNNPQWQVLRHDQHQHGLTILGCADEDRPKKPGLIKMASNFVKHKSEYIASGSEQVTEEVYQARLETCSLCTHRVDDSCSICGCPLKEKAKGRVYECDLGFWKQADEQGAGAAPGIVGREEETEE